MSFYNSLTFYSCFLPSGWLLLQGFGFVSLKNTQLSTPTAFRAQPGQEVLYVLVNDVSFEPSGAQSVGDIVHHCRTLVPGIKPGFVLGMARAGMKFSLYVTSSEAENAAEM